MTGVTQLSQNSSPVCGSCSWCARAPPKNQASQGQQGKKNEPGVWSWGSCPGSATGLCGFRHITKPPWAHFLMPFAPFITDLESVIPWGLLSTPQKSIRQSAICSFSSTPSLLSLQWWKDLMCWWLGCRGMGTLDCKGNQIFTKVSRDLYTLITGNRNEPKHLRPTGS